MFALKHLHIVYCSMYFYFKDIAIISDECLPKHVASHRRDFNSLSSAKIINLHFALWFWEILI